MPVPDTIAQLNPYGPLVTFKSTDILPPSALYLGPSDSIVVNCQNPTVAITLSVWYRILRPDGTLISTTDTFTSPTPPGSVNFTIPPTEGFLLSMVIQASGVSRGQCYVRVFLSQAGLSQNVVTLAQMFLAGYVSTLDNLSYPQGVPESSLSGRGWLRDVIFPNTTGAPSSIVVPASVHWLIRCAAISCSTSAVVVNRLLEFVVLDPTLVTSCRVPATGVQPASVTTNYVNAPGLNGVVLQADQSAGAPNDLIVPAGWTVRYQVFNMDAGDQLSAGVLTVEEFVGQ